MSDDTISRQAAIDAINGLHDKPNAWLDCAVDTIKTLPSADNDSLYERLNEAHNEGYDVGYWAGRRDYEQKWIPCSERMPEPVAPSQRREWFITSNQYGGVACTCYEFEASPFKVGWQTDMTILAWMPLPDPYKGE